MILASPPHSPLLRRRARGVGIATLVVAPLLVGMLLSSDVAVGREDTAIEPVGSLVADDSLDPRLLGLDLGGGRWLGAVAELDEALFEERTIIRGLERAREELRDVRADLRLAVATDGEVTELTSRIETEIDEARALLEASAIAQFVRSGETESEILASAEMATEGSRRIQLSAKARDVQLTRWRELLDRSAQLTGELSELGGRILELRIREQSLTASVRVGEDALTEVQARIDRAIDTVRGARRGAAIPGVDIPVTALDAYLNAEVLLAEAEPACGIEWWMIAGVGRVESRHGELGGRRLTDVGHTTPEIIGIALDGGPNVRAVVDTDDGALDGDPVWDRAVGPMQFIPETWSIRGRDGNGDGRVDPHNIYDAAYTTGRYLCRLGGDLTTPWGRDAAYFGYNTSDDYVADVSKHAERYRDGLQDRLE